MAVTVRQSGSGVSGSHIGVFSGGDVDNGGCGVVPALGVVR